MLGSRQVNSWLQIIRKGGLTCTSWSFVATCASDAITDLSSSSSSLSPCLRFSIIFKNRLVSCVVRSDSLRFLAIVLRLRLVVGGKSVVMKKEVESVTAIAKNDVVSEDLSRPTHHDGITKLEKVIVQAIVRQTAV